MNRRERLERAFTHQPMDRPAVYSRMGLPGNDPTYDRLRAYLANHTEQKTGWWAAAFEAPPAVETFNEPIDDDYERQITVMHTPGGDLRRASRVSRKGLPGLHETFFLQDREDAQRYLSLPPSRPLTADPRPSFEECVAAIGDRGIVDVQLGHCPAGTVAELFGSEQFAIMTLTDRDVLHALAAHHLQVLTHRVQVCLDHGIGPFFSMAGEEFVVPPLHGVDDFRDFVVRYDKPLIDMIHDAGGRVHIHCQGPLRDLLPDFVAMGVDVLHPIESPPMGNITAAKAKAVLRGEVTMEGNIQIARMYDASPAEVAEETRQLIADAFDDQRGLIVSATASPWIRGAGERCFEQYRAMIDTVLAASG